MEISSTYGYKIRGLHVEDFRQRLMKDHLEMMAFEKNLVGEKIH